MVSSASASKQRTLDPAARDFVPGFHEADVFHYADSAARTNYSDTYNAAFSGAQLSPFNPEYFHHHVSFPPPPPPPPSLPSSIYDWQPNTVQPRYYHEWPANIEALHSQTQQAFPSQLEAQGPHSQQTLLSAPLNQQQQVFHYRHHQAFYSQSGQQQAFHSQNVQQQLVPATSGHESRHQLQQQHYGDQYQVFRVPAPQIAAPPLLQAPVLMQNYAFQGPWEPPPAAPALGQPAFPTVTTASTVAIPRGSGNAQPFMGRDRMSRALQLIGVPTEMSEAQLMEELGQWGEIRALELSRHSEGLSTVHYFDLRCAKSALADIQNQHLLHQQRVQQQLSQDRRSLEFHASRSPPHDHSSSPPQTADVQSSPAASIDQFPAIQLATPYSPTSDIGQIERSEGSELSSVCQIADADSLLMRGSGHMASSESSTTGKGLVGGKPVWAHYTIPVGLDSEDCLNQGTLSPLNQGTLVVFNLDASMHADVVRAIFDRHGTVKEVREAPQKRHHKFVEFYDVRHAAVALQALDGTELEGKKLKIEFSRPGGSTSKRASPNNMPHMVASSSIIVSQNVPALGHNLLAMPPPPPPPPPLAPPNVYWQQLPLAQPEPTSVAATWSHTSMHGSSALLPAPGPPQPYDGYASHLLPSSMPHVNVFASTSRASSMERDHHLPTPLYRVVPPRQAAPRGGTLSEHASIGEGRARGDGERSKRRETPSTSTSSSLLSSSPWRNHTGIRRGAAAASMQANECFRFDENEAESSGRTTLMIRNIPNKYTQEMLIAMLDDHCMDSNRNVEEPSDASGEPMSAFDFVYLPIDFKYVSGNFHGV